MCYFIIAWLSQSISIHAIDWGNCEKNELSSCSCVSNGVHVTSVVSNPCNTRIRKEKVLQKILHFSLIISAPLCHVLITTFFVMNKLVYFANMKLNVIYVWMDWLFILFRGIYFVIIYIIFEVWIPFTLLPDNQASQVPSFYASPRQSSFTSKRNIFYIGSNGA